MNRLITILCLAPALAWGACPSIPDTDGDGVPDSADNCIRQPNGPLIPDAGGNSQRDTDEDGFGNMCDPDFNNNGLVEAFDFSLVRSVIGSTNAPDQDLNGNGIVEAFDFSLLKATIGQPPGPSSQYPPPISADPIACATTEDLQVSGGLLPFPGGTLIIPWEQMQPTETVSVSADPTQLTLDAIAQQGSAISVTAPDSVTHFTVDFDLDPDSEQFVVAVKEEGAALDSDPYPWSFVDALIAEVEIQARTFKDGARRFLLVPFFGQVCDYDRGDVFVSVYREQACAPEPVFLVDVVDAVRATRSRFSGEGFPLTPTQEVIFLSGANAPVEASSIRGINYVNAEWYSLLTLLERQAVMFHETFHSIDYGFLGEQGERNWVIEASAVAAEWMVDPANTSWIDRYAWGPDVVERGLGGAIRSPDELYNPWFLLHLVATDPNFSLYGLYSAGGAEILEDDTITALVKALGTDYEDLRQRHGEAASVCHQDNIPLQNVSGLCGTGDLEEVNLDGPAQLAVGETVAWPNLIEGDVTLHVGSSPDANADTLITLQAVNGPLSISVDGTLQDDYPLGALPVGDYVIIVSSVDGEDFLGLDEYVTVQMIRTTCAGEHPELFNGFEEAVMYDAACTVIEPGPLPVSIHASTTAVHCMDTLRGLFTVQVSIPLTAEWPHRVVGVETGASIPDEYWPSTFDSGNGQDVCDRPFGVYAAGPSPGSHYYRQQVSWLYDCGGGAPCSPW